MDGGCSSITDDARVGSLELGVLELVILHAWALLRQSHFRLCSCCHSSSSLSGTKEREGERKRVRERQSQNSYWKNASWGNAASPYQVLSRLRPHRQVPRTQRPLVGIANPTRPWMGGARASLMMLEWGRSSLLELGLLLTCLDAGGADCATISLLPALANASSASSLSKGPACPPPPGAPRPSPRRPPTWSAPSCGPGS